METLAEEGVATVLSSTRDEESRCSHSWLEGYIERLEGEKARKEFFASYECHEIMATLLA